LWRDAVDKVLRYLPKVFSRDELLADKPRLYRMIGAIELNKKEFEGVDISMIPSRFFSGDLKERLLVPVGEQVPFEQWDGTDRWGLTFSFDNLSEYLQQKLKDYPEMFQRRYVEAIFNDDMVIIANQKVYLLPEFQEVPMYILEATRARFFQFENQDIYDWAEVFFNILPKKEYTRSREYFSMKNLFPDQKQFPYCSSEFHFINGMRDRNQKLDVYISTLENHKKRIQEIMGISNDFYNELAATAIGVLLVETKMGHSFKYKLKEFRLLGIDWGQGLVNMAKYFTGEQNQENSRGLTQIKILEDLKRWVSGTEYEYLMDADYRKAENAALATIFTLREKLNHLQGLQDRHTNIDDYNWSDYLYYLYNGSYDEITKGTATPNLNIKIRKILELKDSMYIFENCEES
jgi:hypothetical protein